MATAKFFREVELPQQKLQPNGVLFPAVLSQNHTTDELRDFIEAIRAHKLWLDSLLQKSGAILFRGFPVTSPSDFNDVVEAFGQWRMYVVGRNHRNHVRFRSRFAPAFGYPEAFYVGGRASRIKVLGRVYTANESPPERGIPFHHEMAYVRDFPTKLFFFCDEEPGKGGETPIVLSHIIYEKMKEKHPHFVAKLEEHGLTYTKLSSKDDDPSSFTGSGWKSTYKTDDKKVAEERAAKLGAKLEWIGNTAKITTGPLPAVRLDNESRRKAWFNSIAVSYSGPANKRFCSGDTVVELGNGDPVPDHAVEDYLKILEEECVAIPWRKGDVMLVNNLTVLHGRRPLLKPPRRILASLCK